MNRSSNSSEPVQARSLGIRSLILLLVVGAILSSLSRGLYSMDQSLEKIQSSFLVTWLILVVVQISFCVVSCWPGRSNQISFTRQQLRRRNAFALTFEIGLLPVLLFVLSVLALKLGNYDQSLWAFLAFLGQWGLAALALASIPLKLLTMVIFCGHRDRYSVVGARIAILINTSFPFLIWKLVL